jgi:tRNA threonylcarbamoyladenosine biosynthesis protein TsaE
MPLSYTYESQSLDETARLAETLAKHATPGMMITLDGDLGAGKTAFSQYFARSMGVTEVVNSPTFTLIKEYQGELHPLYHMDVYRLSLLEADDLGLDDYFYGDGVTLLEWADKIEALLPDERLEIRMERGEGEHRYFTIYPHGPTYLKLCNLLKENGVLQ